MTLSIAVPNKGRLKEPSTQLLRDAGLAFEITDRALSVPVRNADVELLFVRTEDIPELVSDGVARLGITGIDLLAERGIELETLVELGYGHCALAVAVPEDSPVEKIDELAGLRVATAHPSLTAQFFAERAMEVTVVPLRGSVEVATKLGVAEAIVDLVSTGSTLKVNGLRRIATVFDSQAVLVAGPGDPGDVRPVVIAVRAVVAGRSKRYLLLNAPAAAAAAIEALIPGLSSPTVVPLVDPSMVAIHSVVDAEHLWSLLPVLEEAGARGILVLPIERLIA